MAEDFQANNWWKTSRESGGSGVGGGFDGGSPARSNVSCSTTITDVTGAPFAWVGGGAARPMMDSTLQLSGFGLSSPSMDWNQALLSSGGRAESSFQAMLQEDLNSRSNFSAAMDAGESSSSVQLRDMNHPFFFENSIISSGTFPLVSSSSSSSIMQGLLEPDSRPELSIFDSQHMLQYQHSQFLQQKQQSAIINHLQFANNTPFWNASATAQPFEFPMKSLDGGREKKSSSEPAMKKIRAETPSTLPTFKVRKEKLGDRITALQQLVSPFGKTDTASVLHEAIEYIKFLHEQVSVLSTPYLKNGHPMQQQQQQSLEKLKEGEWQKQDLRSRGLCLVPISSTCLMATEPTADFWTPTFGGTYR